MNIPINESLLKFILLAVSFILTTSIIVFIQHVITVRKQRKNYINTVIKDINSIIGRIEHNSTVKIKSKDGFIKLEGIGDKSDMKRLKSHINYLLKHHNRTL